MPSVNDTNVLIDYENWEGQPGQLRGLYQAPSPYPHIVLDNFLTQDTAERNSGVFIVVDNNGWIHCVHFNERKHVLHKAELLPPWIREAIEEFNPPRFVK